MKKFLLPIICIFILLLGFNKNILGQSAPTVTSTNPAQNNDATTITQNVSTTFSQNMNGATTAVNSAIRVIGNKRGSYS